MAFDAMRNVYTDSYGLYLLIHELGHMIDQRSIGQLQASGYYTWRGRDWNSCTTCRDGTRRCNEWWGRTCNDERAHDELWHKCCLFL